MRGGGRRKQPARQAAFSMLSSVTCATVRVYSCGLLIEPEHTCWRLHTCVHTYIHRYIRLEPCRSLPSGHPACIALHCINIHVHCTLHFIRPLLCCHVCRRLHSHNNVINVCSFQAATSQPSVLLFAASSTLLCNTPSFYLLGITY